MHSLPWLCGGYFNKVLSHDEKTENHAHSNAHIVVFREVLSDCGLQDIGFLRNPFTWTNNWDSSHLGLERLDHLDFYVS